MSIYKPFSVADIVRTLRTLNRWIFIVRIVRVDVRMTKAPPLLIVRIVRIVRTLQ